MAKGGNFQTFKLSNFQTLKIWKFQTFKLSPFFESLNVWNRPIPSLSFSFFFWKIDSWKVYCGMPSRIQTFKLLKLSNFQTFKLSYFRVFGFSKFHLYFVFYCFWIFICFSSPAVLLVVDFYRCFVISLFLDILFCFFRFVLFLQSLLFFFSKREGMGLFQTFKLSNFQTLKLFKLSNFSNFQTTIFPNLQTYLLIKKIAWSNFQSLKRWKNDSLNLGSNFESLKVWKFESLKSLKVWKFESLKVWENPYRAPVEPL